MSPLDPSRVTNPCPRGWQGARTPRSQRQGSCRCLGWDLIVPTPAVSREREEMEAASVRNDLGYRSGRIRGYKRGLAAPVSVRRLGCSRGISRPHPATDTSRAFPSSFSEDFPALHQPYRTGDTPQLGPSRAVTNGAGAAPRRVLPAGDTATALGGTAVTGEVARRGGTERCPCPRSAAPGRAGREGNPQEIRGNPGSTGTGTCPSLPPPKEGETVMRIIEQEVDANEDRKSVV